LETAIVGRQSEIFAADDATYSQVVLESFVSRHGDNFKTPGGPRVSTDEQEEVPVVTEAKTPTQQPKDMTLSVGSVACLSESSVKQGGSNCVQTLLCHFDTPVVQQGESLAAAEFVLDALVSSSPPVAGLGDTDVKIGRLEDVLGIKDEKRDKETRRHIQASRIAKLLHPPTGTKDNEGVGYDGEMVARF
jgi:hypothetical protein